MFEEYVDVEDQHAMLMDLISHPADNIRAAVPNAFEKALATQRKDVVRDRKVWRGDVQPCTHSYQAGAYVYCAQPPLNTAQLLDVRRTHTILRCKR
jgi:hypothetical protein